MLISEEDGQINWPSEKGLYFFDTRIVSSWTIYANGEPWELLNGGAISYFASRIFLTNRSLVTQDGPIPQRTLGLTISRWISGGMHEDLDVVNNNMKPVRFQLEIALRCDFADIFEVKSGRIVRRGRITTEWSEPDQHLRTTYRNGDFSRAVTISPRARHKGGIRQWTAQLRGGAQTGRDMALLPPLFAGRRRPAFCFADRLRRAQPQVGHRRGDGGLAKKRCQDPDQQRGILSSVSPGA